MCVGVCVCVDVYGAKGKTGERESQKEGWMKGTDTAGQWTCREGRDAPHKIWNANRDTTLTVALLKKREVPHTFLSQKRPSICNRTPGR